LAELLEYFIPLCISNPISPSLVTLHVYHSSQLDGDIATIGITAHAADALGDIVFVELPAVGSEYSAGDSFGAVESVKAGT